MIPILPPTPENLRRAADALRAGGLVGMPTETVYGLAAHALDPAALARVFEVKRRPFFDPLIVHVADPGAVGPLCRDLPDDAAILMERFWPGPLTLALPKSDLVPDLATAGLGTVAVRMPAHPAAHALLRQTGFPLAAPSANPFGALSPTTAEHVAAAFEGGIDCVLDGGPCAIGVESTVIGWTEAGPVLLRPGGVAAEDIESALGRPLRRGAPGTEGEAAASPGALPWHYAPRTPLRMLEPGMPVADPAHAGLLWFGAAPAPEGFARTENLSPAGELREAASQLFAALHRLDAAGLREIFAAAVPDRGLGLAINDRLRKAAAAPR